MSFFLKIWQTKNMTYDWSKCSEPIICHVFFFFLMVTLKYVQSFKMEKWTVLCHCLQKMLQLDMTLKFRLNLCFMCQFFFSMINTCSIICTAHTLSQTGQIGVRGGCKGASEGREMMTTTKMNVTLKRR